MSPDRLINRARIVARSVLLAYLAAACSTWAAVAPPRLNTRSWESVRLELRDGRQVLLRETTLSGDSLVASDHAGNRIAAAVADVRSMEIRRFDAVQTAWVVIGVAAFIAFALFWFYYNLGPAEG
jgi:hypothetical protein